MTTTSNPDWFPACAAGPLAVYDSEGKLIRVVEAKAIPPYRALSFKYVGTKHRSNAAMLGIMEAQDGTRRRVTKHARQVG